MPRKTRESIYKIDDRVELSLNLRPPSHGLVRHRGHVTYVDPKKPIIWVLMDIDTKILPDGTKTHRRNKSAHILHEQAKNLRKLSLLELLAEAAS